MRYSVFSVHGHYPEENRGGAGHYRETLDHMVLAEDYAMIDVLSRGRLILGVGSAYLAHEFEGFGVPGGSMRLFAERVIPALNGN